MHLRTDLDKASKQQAEQICKQIISQYNDKLVNPSAGKTKAGGIFDNLDISELVSDDDSPKAKAQKKGNVN
jgi:hypothetical protein